MQPSDIATLKSGDKLFIARNHLDYLRKYRLIKGMKCIFSSKYIGSLSDRIYVLLKAPNRDRGEQYIYWIYSCMVERAEKRGHKLTNIFK